MSGAVVQQHADRTPLAGRHDVQFPVTVEVGRRDADGNMREGIEGERRAGRWGKGGRERAAGAGACIEQDAHRDGISVGDRKVQPAIAIEIPHHEVERVRHTIGDRHIRAERDLRARSSIGRRGVHENPQRAAAAAGCTGLSADGNVGLAVAIEVADLHKEAWITNLDLLGRGERRRCAPGYGRVPQDGNRSGGAAIRDDEIRLAVAIEVADRDANRSVPGRKLLYRSEGNRGGVHRRRIHQHRDLVATAVGNGEVGLAVAIEIRSDYVPAADAANP